MRGGAPEHVCKQELHLGMLLDKTKQWQLTINNSVSRNQDLMWNSENIAVESLQQRKIVNRKYQILLNRMFILR